MTDLVFGRAVRPDIVEMICEKPYAGAGFTLLSYERGPFLLGPCQHITDGYGEIEFYHQFFSTGGERQFDALVDFVIGRDGRIGMLNDPFGRRAGWASGGSDGLEGDGIAFYRKYGPAQNTRLYSKEHVGKQNDQWPVVQWNSSVALDVWMLDRLGMRWDTYPIHPIELINVDLYHFEFATKPCPGPYLRSQTTRFQADVRAGLKAVQVVLPDPKIPNPPKPEVPDIYPPGITPAFARKRFGRLKRHHLNGTVTEHRFNDKGAISIIWLKRCGELAIFPEAQDHYFVADNDHGPTRDRVTLEIVTFECGWILGRPADRAEWSWLF